MKTNKFYLYIFLMVSVLFSSCDGFLDVTPHDSLASENALITIEDYQNLVVDPYTVMRSDAYMTNFMLLVPEVMSDNLILNSLGRQTWSEFYRFNFNSTTYGTQRFWLSCYNGIMSVNEIITRLESNNPFAGTEHEAASKNVLAEALAIRGLMHFDLVKFYGKSYTSANDTDLGVPIKLIPEVTTPPRNTIKEVYTQIITDLEAAYSGIADTYNSGNNNRLNKKSVAAVLARVYLTMKRYDKAAEYASYAIAGDGSDICKIGDYTKLWSTSMKVPEVLFRIAVLQTDPQEEIPGANFGQGNVNDYQAEYAVSYSFVEMFDFDTDIRATQIQEVAFDGNKYNVIWKYFGRTGESAGKVDIPVIRTSEMYLTRAEANYFLNKQEDALRDLNLLRKNRYLEFEDGSESGGLLLNAIEKERRLELAFEGHRFFDIKRNNYDIQRDDKGDHADGSGVPATVQFIPSTSYYYQIPIPQSEMDANDNMVQNQY